MSNLLILKDKKLDNYCSLLNIKLKKNIYKNQGKLKQSHFLKFSYNIKIKSLRKNIAFYFFVCLIHSFYSRDQSTNTIHNVPKFLVITYSTVQRLLSISFKQRIGCRVVGEKGWDGGWSLFIFLQNECRCFVLRQARAKEGKNTERKA